MRPLVFQSALVFAWLAFAPVASRAQSPQDLAGQIRKHPKIALADAHVSKVNDQATALKNISDVAAGKKAQRSKYENAPGGEIALDSRILKGMLQLARTYSFRVSEIAGGSHSKNSRHYVGIAFDVSQINGKQVGKNHPDFKAFMKKAIDLGASEILGPGDKGHDHHVHVAWSRP